MESGRLYVVTATLNNWAHTKRLIQALGETKTDNRLIVIDNGSTDETLLELAKLTPNVILVANEENLGVSVSWNLGIRIAHANGARGVLVCGNDTVPQPGCVDRLAKLIEQHIPFVTGTAIPYDSPPVPCPELQSTDSLRNSPDFSFFAFNIDTITVLGLYEAKGNNKEIAPWQCGLFDERFTPAYFEDNDYHLRLQRAGILAVQDPQALFRHDTSLTVRTTPAIAQQNNETFSRNGEIFRIKWGGLPHELDIPAQARPSNVTDEQWEKMTGGRPVEEVSQRDVIFQAERTYAANGLQFLSSAAA